MSSNNTQLLTTHLFASKNDPWYGFEEMLKRLDEAGITSKLYKPDYALLECRTITIIYLIKRLFRFIKYLIYTFICF